MPRKGSKDSTDSLDSKQNLEPKYGFLGCQPGPGNLNRKGVKTCPYCDFTHKESKTKNNF